MHKKTSEIYPSEASASLPKCVYPYALISIALLCFELSSYVYADVDDRVLYFLLFLVTPISLTSLSDCTDKINKNTYGYLGALMGAMLILKAPVEVSYLACAVMSICSMIYLSEIEQKLSRNKGEDYLVRQQMLLLHFIPQCFVVFKLFVLALIAAHPERIGLQYSWYSVLLCVGVLSTLYLLNSHFRQIVLNYIQPNTKETAEEDEEVMFLEHIFLEIDKNVKEQQLYKIKRLTLHELSEKTGISVRDVSRAINLFHKMSFNDYINDLRVEAFIASFLKSDCKMTCILDLAFEVGFNSKTSFNKHFKRKYNCAPSQLKEKQPDAQIA